MMQKSKLKRNITILFFALLFFVFLPPILLRAGENGQYSQLPYQGDNFACYVMLPYLAGRCYLLTPLCETVVAAYEDLKTGCPDKYFIYLEMGWKGGGRFYPHKTHQEGRSADFLTPMLDKKNGLPGHLPLSMANRWGYDLRLTSAGEYGDLQLDAVGMIKHIAALERQARKRGWRIERVIFDPPLLAALQRNSEYHLIRNIPFMRNKAWFPHDGHYHIDFIRIAQHPASSSP